MTISHFNSITRFLKRIFKKTLKIRFNVSLVTPVTKKPREVRMGKGKGQRLY
jgi:ribosomal protein L16/L10AE